MGCFPIPLDLVSQVLLKKVSAQLLFFSAASFEHLSGPDVFAAVFFLAPRSPVPHFEKSPRWFLPLILVPILAPSFQEGHDQSGRGASLFLPRVP